MGRHTGVMQEAASSGVDRRRLLVLSAGLTLTLVAWGFLVWLAIGFGTEAVDGTDIAWLLLAVAALGATGALFLGLILGSKALATLRGEVNDPRPPRPPRGVAGKRAAR